MIKWLKRKLGIEDLETTVHNGIDRLHEIISDRAVAHKKLHDKFFDLETCESCGCLVDKGKATKGPGEVRYKDGQIVAKSGGIRGFTLNGVEVWSAIQAQEEYIYHPYYCKRCWGLLAKEKKGGK